MAFVAETLDPSKIFGLWWLTALDRDRDPRDGDRDHGTFQINQALEGPEVMVEPQQYPLACSCLGS
ncbi:MAG: hypothetical protein R3B67_03160 [Phycisphaerales bacterium]